MKKRIVFAFVAATSMFAWATPTVSGVTVEQNGLRTVKVTYRLDKDAVVTLDILTNTTDGAWSSIGSRNITHTWGDVNKLVRKSGDGATSEHVCYWAADRSWKGDVGDKVDVKAVVKAWAVNAPPDYMVVDILPVSGVVRYYESPDQLPDGGVTSKVYKTDRIVMRKIPAKGVTYVMGSPSTEVGRVGRVNDGGVETQHYVTLTNDYYIGVYELTRQQYIHVTDRKIQDASSATKLWPENVEGDNACIPATHDIYKWFDYNQMRGEDFNWPTTGYAVGGVLGTFRKNLGVDFDLPTEAQWEYACRAGVGSALYTGEELSSQTVSENLDEIAWYAGNSENHYHPVGMLKPNGFGLYDMLGNVAEHVLDWRQDDLGTEAVVEPVGPETGSYAVPRGGSYNKDAYHCRAAHRQHWIKRDKDGRHSDIGFRLWAPAIAK